MTERNQNYINTVKMEEIPWHRIPTTYGRATLFPRYFEVLEQMKNIGGSRGGVVRSIHQY